MHASLWAARVVAGLIVLTSAGCGEPTHPVDGPLAGIIVYGDVTDPRGNLAPSVSIEAEALSQGSCSGFHMEQTKVETDVAGRYRVIFTNWGEEFTICVKLRILPPAPFAMDSLQRSPVVMRVRFDSVRVDIALRPAP